MKPSFTLKVTQREAGVVRERADACFGSGCSFPACWEVFCDEHGVIDACQAHVGDACSRVLAQAEIRRNCPAEPARA